jgi:hypothetical protein
MSKPVYVIAPHTPIETAPGEVELQEHRGGVAMFVNGMVVCAVGVNGRRVLDIYGGESQKTGLESDSKGWVKIRRFEDPE